MIYFKKNKINVLIAIIMLILITPLTLFNQGLTFAEDTTYTNVLDDLQKDKDFNIANYPEKISDYSLNVISIAESENKELFIYTYQPSGTLTASHISMATGTDGYFNPSLYSLTFINSYQTLFKYKVNNFTLKSDLMRYYNIPEIFRPFDENLGDKELTNGNTIDEVPFKVAKSWTVCTVDGKLVYTGTDTEVVEITDMYVGFVRYPDGWLDFWPTSCDAHFVAFNTDKSIDKLLEATITFSTQEYSIMKVTAGNDIPSYKEIITTPNYNIEASDTGVFNQGGIFGVKKNWKRIETVEDFIQRNNEESNEIFNCGIFNVETWSKMTEESLKDLEDKQWVLNFKETDFWRTKHNTYTSIHGTMVGDVAILRLEFETTGQVYNLGVVGNMQTGDGHPDNTSGTKFSLSWWMWAILALLVVIVIIAFVPNLIVTLLNLVIKIFKWLFNLIKKLFQNITKIFKSFKKNKNG